MLRPSIAGGTTHVEAYEKAFSQIVLGTDLPALAFWRGRVALWTIVRAIDAPAGQDVVLHAYTCEMVPAAVKFAGAKCIYADVEPCRVHPAASRLAAAVTGRTAAVLCQHTYGIRQPTREVARLAGEVGAVLVEDCCQRVPTGPETGANAIHGAAAFFSTQWNKPFSTGLGGMAVFRDHDLYRQAKRIRDGFPRKGIRGRAWLLAFEVLLHDMTVRPATRGVVGRIYRSAQRAGLVRGTTTPDEFGDRMPPDYLAGATNVQALVGLEHLRRWDQNVMHRRMLTAFYLEAVSSLSIYARA